MSLLRTLRPWTRQAGRALCVAAILLALPATAFAAPPRLIVFAAASLKNALDAVNAQFAKTHRPAAISYAATSTLAKQIAADAPADVFVSADLRWMDYVEKQHKIKPASRIDLLANSLVLIAPKTSRVKTRIGPGFPLVKLLQGGRLAIADPDSVPAGLYGKAALKSLGVWRTAKRHLAPAQNVRAALLLVARGEAPLGIVYKTDALVEPLVRIVATFPASSHPPIIYPMALTAGSTNPEAPVFTAYLKGRAAGKIFEAQGFTVLAK